MKYNGLTIEQVAKVDPSYLTWMWNEENIYNNLPDEAAYALDDTMSKYGVSYERSRRRKNK